MTPFLTFYTPTFRRPQALLRCMASVQGQTMAHAIEHLIVPDYVGRGVAGMYGEVPKYVDAVHGEYVHFLADDDVLMWPGAVEAVHHTLRKSGSPHPVILVRVIKGGMELPIGQGWPPVCGHIDLGCLIVRRDVWQDTVKAGGYGLRYEGDFDFAEALFSAGHRPLVTAIPFMSGAVMHGAAEVPPVSQMSVGADVPGGGAA